MSFTTDIPKSLHDHERGATSDLLHEPRGLLVKLTGTPLLFLLLKVFILLCCIKIDRAQKKCCLPASLARFRSCRRMFDCMEVQAAIPTPMDEQRVTFSQYKQRNTFKGLLGMASCGFITFSSNLYPGCTNDKEVVGHLKIRTKWSPAIW